MHYNSILSQLQTQITPYLCIFQCQFVSVRVSSCQFVSVLSVRVSSLFRVIAVFTLLYVIFSETNLNEEITTSIYKLPRLITIYHIHGSLNRHWGSWGLGNTMSMSMA